MSSKDIARYQGRSAALPLSRERRDERQVARAYTAAEREHMLERAAVQRTGEIGVAVTQAAGEIAWNAQGVTEAIGANRDAAVARHGESLTSLDVDRVTEACQGAIAELSVASIRGLRDRM
jgi:hypothetical protein